MKRLPYFLLFFSITLHCFVEPCFADEIFTSSFSDSNSENSWQAPPPIDENDRLVKFQLQADYQQDANPTGQVFSMFDLSAKRQLDENFILAEGLVRFRKALSTSDSSNFIDLRLARLSYLESWLQVTVGRFDLFESLTPNLFFGGYPIMGIHRVDGVLATLPFSFFFDLGPSKQGKTESSAPLALSFFYTPSLFSAQQVQYDLTQSFWLSQIRFRIDAQDLVSTFRVNIGSSANDFFDYSSINGAYTGSASVDLSFQKNTNLTFEYGVQNLNRPMDTGVLSAGLQVSRLGTWGAFSFDQIALEAQFPLGNSLGNPFTGGNGNIPTLAQTPQTSWYAKLRTRLRLLFFELHLTNNQNDYTLARPSPGSIGGTFTGPFGPGNETDGPGTPLRSSGYTNVALLIRTGVEF